MAKNQPLTPKKKTQVPSQKEPRPIPQINCKIFWEQTFANFLEQNFGLEFAVP
jgi:hypothetical protein